MLDVRAARTDRPTGAVERAKRLSLVSSKLISLVSLLQTLRAFCLHNLAKKLASLLQAKNKIQEGFLRKAQNSENTELQLELLQQKKGGKFRFLHRCISLNAPGFFIFRDLGDFVKF